MIAALGNFNVGGMTGRRQQSRRCVVVEIAGQVGDGPGPGFAGETPLGFTRLPFGSGCEDHEGGRCGGPGHSRGRQDTVEFAGPDHRIHFRNVFLNFVAKALDQATGHNQLLGVSPRLQAGHIQNGINRLLLGRVNEGTGIDDDNVSILSLGSQVGACLHQHPHHYFAVNQVLRATQADEGHLLRSFGGSTFPVGQLHRAVSI